MLECTLQSVTISSNEIKYNIFEFIYKMVGNLENPYSISIMWPIIGQKVWNNTSSMA